MGNHTNVINNLFILKLVCSVELDIILKLAFNNNNNSQIHFTSIEQQESSGK